MLETPDLLKDEEKPLTKMQVIMRQPEVVEKCRIAQLGKKRSQETKDKISKSKTGKKIADRGPGWRQKMRLVHLGKKKSPEAVVNMRLCQLGKKHLPETIEKMVKTRAAKAAAGHRIPGLNCPPYKDRRVTREKQIIPVKDTRIEKLLQAELERLGFRPRVDFKPHYCIKGARKTGTFRGRRGLFHQYDAAIPKMKLVIEMNGCYWHGCPRCFPEPSDAQKSTIERDAFIAEVAAALGWRLVTIWEHEIEHLSELVQAAVTR